MITSSPSKTFGKYHLKKTVRFGALNSTAAASSPFWVQLHKNELLNRFAIDTLGYSSWSVIIARNKYERLENALDWGGWLLAGLALPYVIERGVNRLYHSKLAKKFKHRGVIKNVKNKQTLLSMPFQWLDKTAKKQLNNKSGKAAAVYGIKNFKKMTPKLANAVMWGKLLILWIDLLLLAGKNQGYAWVKNWLTEKLSGKKGFSGEFKYASNDYLKQQSQKYEQSKKKRKIISLSIGFGGALLFPLALLAVLKIKGKSSASKWLKNKVKAFNYTDAIFMSKWVLLVSNLTNWAPATILSSRDKHEMREKITKMLVFDALFFLGDDLISGVTAKLLSKNKKLETVIVKKGKTLGLPRLVPLHEVYQKTGFNKKSLAYRLARNSFITGLLGTAAALGIAMPLLNFYFTKKKVLKEQNAGKIGVDLTLYNRPLKRKQVFNSYLKQLKAI